MVLLCLTLDVLWIVFKREIDMNETKFVWNSKKNEKEIETLTPFLNEIKIPCQP